MDNYNKKRKLVLCERCKENEAVCIWDSHGEYYGCDVCEKCCAELADVKQKESKNKPMRRKADPFYDIKYASLFMMYAFVAMLTWAFRDPHINYSEIFKLNNLLSFLCLTAFGHISALVLSYNKRKRKLHSILVIGLEISIGILGACATFDNRFKYDSLSIITIVCLNITIAVAISLLIIQNKKRINECIPTWLRITIVVAGTLSSLIAMTLISIKDMIELNMFPFRE